MSQHDSRTSDIAARIRAVRLDRGWSTAELADRCAAAGMPSLNRPILANLEHGRRRYITVDELLAVAEALDVPPVRLMQPGLRATFAGKYRVDREAAKLGMAVRELRELVSWLAEVVDQARPHVDAGLLERVDARVDVLQDLLADFDELRAATPHVRVEGAAYSEEPG